MLAAGSGQTAVGHIHADQHGRRTTSAAATVAITVLKATPLITWAKPADITAGTPLGATQLNAMANVPGTFTYTPPSGTVLRRRRRAGSSRPRSRRRFDANYNTASKTVAITVNGTPTTAHNAARANAYDDAWQDGTSGWVANAKAILAGGSGQSGHGDCGSAIR